MQERRGDDAGYEHYRDEACDPRGEKLNRESKNRRTGGQSEKCDRKLESGLITGGTSVGFDFIA